MKVSSSYQLTYQKCGCHSKIVQGKMLIVQFWQR